jgi:hypothetical protein
MSTPACSSPRWRRCPQPTQLFGPIALTVLEDWSTSRVVPQEVSWQTLDTKVAHAWANSASIGISARGRITTEVIEKHRAAAD